MVKLHNNFFFDIYDLIFFFSLFWPNTGLDAIVIIISNFKHNTVPSLTRDGLRIHTTIWCSINYLLQTFIQCPRIKFIRFTYRLHHAGEETAEQVSLPQRKTGRVARRTSWPFVFETSDLRRSRIPWRKTIDPKYGNRTVSMYNINVFNKLYMKPGNGSSIQNKIE